MARWSIEQLTAYEARRKSSAPKSPQEPPPEPTPRKSLDVVSFQAIIAHRNLPPAVPEFRFDPARRWRFDFAWPGVKVALEVQGGIWTQGRHSRGAALLKEWEKLNRAAVLGWRILYCQPDDLLSEKTLGAVGACINYNETQTSPPGGA